MPTFDDLLAAYPLSVQATARRARALVLDVLPGAVEQVRLGWKNVTFGRSAAMGDTLFAICPQRDRVNLNLFGASLPDPAGLVEGTGVRVRHVKLRAPEAAADPALRALLEAAARAAAAGDLPDAPAKPPAEAPPRGYKLDVSRTLRAPLDAVYAAWSEPASRRAWLELPAAPGGSADLVVRRATPLKSMRATWPDGSWLAVTFEARGAERARVNVEHSRLTSPERVAWGKAFWPDQLARLTRWLAGAPAAAPGGPPPVVTR